MTKGKLYRIFLALGLWGFVSCSEVKYSANSSCVGVTGSQCVVGPNGDLILSGSEVVGGGKVDILIVNDNSASMSFEQSALASRFANFIGFLDSKEMDYRLSMITTDISSPSNPPRAINQNGLLQDGRLIPLDGGLKFMTPQTGTASQRTLIFEKAIRRNETLSCENFIMSWVDSGRATATPEYQAQYVQHCPSSDERGLYAANLVISNNPDSFIRPEADLAIIILSDEDERSQQYWNNTPGFSLDPLDKAEGLTRTIKDKYPNKKFAIHAFITKTEPCLAAQSSQTRGVVGASYGWEYFKATQLTGGVSGSICSSDFTSQLRDIFNNITVSVLDKIQLYCPAPMDLQVESGGNPFTIVGDQIRFTQKLPVGTKVSYSYKCPPKVN